MHQEVIVTTATIELILNPEDDQRLDRLFNLICMSALEAGILGIRERFMLVSLSRSGPFL